MPQLKTTHGGGAARCVSGTHRISKTEMLILIAIIVLQVLTMLFVGCKKQGYHIDEIYSYILSNSYDSDRISTDASVWNTWVPGERFNEFVTVQPQEGFAYGHVYFNNSTDCHPPFYYWLLHTICSFFPNQFNQWFGLSINIFSHILSTVLVYLISDMLIRSERLKFLPSIMYGFSKFALDNFLFIRMYMLLTTLTLCSIYIYLRMLKDGVSGKRAICSFLLVFAGAMTHYYSLVVNFWCVVLLSSLLLSRKNFREMFLVCGSALAAVILMVLCYPFVITQATGSSTNNIGNEVVKNLFNIKLWVTQTLRLAKGLILSISFRPDISLIIVFLVSIFLLYFARLLVKQKRNSTELPENIIELIGLTLLFGLTCLSISFIGGDYVYIRYIYMIIPLLYIIVFAILDDCTYGRVKVRTVVLSLAIVFSLTNAGMLVAKEALSFLYVEKDETERKISENYSSTPLIVLGNEEEHSTAVPTGNFTTLRSFDKVYLSSVKEVENDDILQETLQKNASVVVYIGTSSYWLDGLKPEKVFERLMDENVFTSEKIADGSLGEYYLVTLQ